MRAIPAALVLVPLLAGTALADPLPFDGRWAWAVEDCDLAPGESDRVPIEIGNGEIGYYESLCTIDRVEPLGSGEGAAWTVTTSCSGEGETWTSQSIFAIEDRGDGTPRQLVDVALDTGFTIIRRECAR